DGVRRAPQADLGVSVSVIRLAIRPVRCASQFVAPSLLWGETQKALAMAREPNTQVLLDNPSLHGEQALVPLETRDKALQFCRVFIDELRHPASNRTYATSQFIKEQSSLPDADAVHHLQQGRVAAEITLFGHG